MGVDATSSRWRWTWHRVCRPLPPWACPRPRSRRARTGSGRNQKLRLQVPRQPRHHQPGPADIRKEGTGFDLPGPWYLAAQGLLRLPPRSLSPLRRTLPGRPPQTHRGCSPWPWPPGRRILPSSSPGPTPREAGVVQGSTFIPRTPLPGNEFLSGREPLGASPRSRRSWWPRRRPMTRIFRDVRARSR